MAEDTNSISGGNEINKIDEDKSKDDSDKKLLAVKKRVVAVPHYLRASTGSCHDACKYGKPHVFKEKPWRVVRRRMSAPQPMTEKTLEIQIFVDNKLKKKSVALEKLGDSPSSEASATNATVKKSSLSSRPSLKSEKTVGSQIFSDNKLKKSVEVDKPDDSLSSEASATNTTVKKRSLSSRPSPKSEKTVGSRVSSDNKLKKSVEVDKLDDSTSNEAPATNTIMKKSFSSSTRSPKSEKTVGSQIFADNNLKKSVGLDKVDDSPSSEAPATTTTMKKSFSSSTRSPKSAKTVASRIFVDNKLKKSVGVEKLDDFPSNKAPATGTTVKKSFVLSRKSSLPDSSKLVNQEARPSIDSSSMPPKVMKKAVLFPSRSSLTASADFSKPPKVMRKVVLFTGRSSLTASADFSNPPKVMRKAVLLPGRSSLTASADFLKRDVSDSINDLGSVSTPSTPKVRSVSARRNHPAVKMPISSDAFNNGLKRQPGTDIKFSDSPRKVLIPSATKLSVKRSPQATTSFHSSRFTSVKSTNVRKTGSSIGQKDRIMMNKAEVKKLNNEVVKEKTLHMIETSEVSNHFIQSPSPLSPESLNSSSQGNSLSFTSNEVELESGSTDSDGDESISNYNRSANSKVVDVDQDSTGLKLKFRRGKVVELESGTRGPRKLKFKQGTVLGDEQVASSGSRRKSSLKKRVVDSDQKDVSTDTDQVKIALKHQETVMKDEQGLYNNVIEETASKLVETRKSKVMALVGAFETVISLQERKPSTAC